MNQTHAEQTLMRFVLQTPGGALPFILQMTPDQPDAFRHDVDDRVIRCSRKGSIRNGSERIAVVVVGDASDVRTRGTIAFSQYDSRLTGEGAGAHADVHAPLEYMARGHWEKVRGDETARIPYTIEPASSVHDRFTPIEHAGAPADFAGRWRVRFSSSGDDAVGLFTVDKDQIASGTFMTTTGDYRYLAGRVDGDLLRLSTFDGAHAFLFHARMQGDATIKGDFWSGNWHHETWSGVRDDNAKLPDAFGQTVIADAGALDELVFRDTAGTPTRVLDALDATGARARVLEVFGTWCPNCADAGRELVSLKAKYGDDLGIVGLAFEVTPDFERSARQVRRHHEHIGSDWEVLIAGLSDKDKATKTLGLLDRVRSYPTLVFLDEHNTVRAVYSGFSGPATGDAYDQQRARFESLIEGLIGG